VVVVQRVEKKGRKGRKKMAHQREEEERRRDPRLMDRSLCERGGEVYRRKTSDYADRFFPYISLSPAACCIYVVYRRSSFVFFFFFLLFFYLLRDQ
jgi:hypothetical protein